MSYKEIDKAIDNAHRDSMRSTLRMTLLQEANNPVECVALLGRLNEAITTMSRLQDAYYTEYIWNASTMQTAALKEAGFDDEYFSMLETQLVKLRAILFGDNLNWDEVYRQMYDEALAYQTYWAEFYENRTTDLMQKINTMERKLRDESKT